MQVGSLVECIDNREYLELTMVTPELKKPYIVRGFIPKGTLIADNGIAKLTAVEDLIYLEEILNDKVNFGLAQVEYAYMAKDFRELLPPIKIDLEEIIEETV